MPASATEGWDQGRADDEQAQACADADLNVLGNQLHNQLPHPENTQQQENGAGDENHSQAYLPGCDAGENNRIGENRIGPHAGGQREGHVGNQAHDNGDQAGHKGGGQQHAHRVHAGFTHVFRLNDEDIGHGGKCSGARNYLSADGGASFLNLKIFQHVAHSLHLLSFSGHLPRCAVQTRLVPPYSVYRVSVLSPPLPFHRRNSGSYNFIIWDRHSPMQ